MSAAVVAAGGAVGARRQDLERLLLHVERATGLRLGPYRRGALRRRIDVRMRLRGVATYAGYLRLLRADPEEAAGLGQALTVHVSRFYRNAESFRALERAVLPELVRRGRSDPVRAWSAGTASGQEAYTLAILWARATAGRAAAPPLELLATDLDAGTLARARAGLYDPAELAEVPPRERRRWFRSEGERVRVVPALRSAVRFRRVDLTEAVRLRFQDLVVCRNVLIYFERDLQEALAVGFHRALRPGGFLMLGKSEMPVGEGRRLFEAVDVRERLFRRRDG